MRSPSTTVLMVSITARSRSLIFSGLSGVEAASGVGEGVA